MRVARKSAVAVLESRAWVKVSASAALRPVLGFKKQRGQLALASLRLHRAEGRHGAQDTGLLDRARLRFNTHPTCSRARSSAVAPARSNSEAAHTFEASRMSCRPQMVASGGEPFASG